MRNFKQELIRQFEIYELSLQDIKCGYVNKSVYTHIGFDDNDDEIQKEQKDDYQLKVNQTQHKFDLWLKLLDFNYENDIEYDIKRDDRCAINDNISISLSGTIWLHNGDWLEWCLNDDYIYESWHLHKIKHISLNLL